MSRPLDDEKRQKIIGAATCVFGDLGFATATIKDIAARADIAAGSVYTYFADKEELFREAVAGSWRQFQEGMERILDSVAPFGERLARLIDFGLEHLRDVHPAVRGMFSDANRLNLFTPHIESITVALDRFFEQAGRSGIIRTSRSPRVRRFVINCIMSGILLAASGVDADGLDATIERLRADTRGMLDEALASARAT
jgi:AcrR family transcriptional regulator